MQSPNTEEAGFLVKNRIDPSFCTLHLVMYGFLLSDYVKNIVEFIVNKTISFPGGLIQFLGLIIIFSYALESVMTFDRYNEREVSNKETKYRILLHIIWFLHFIPLYTISFVSSSKNGISSYGLSVFSLSFVGIYILYLIYVSIEWLHGKKIKDEKLTLSSKRNMYLYIELTIIMLVSFILIQIYSCLCLNAQIYIIFLFTLFCFLKYGFYWWDKFFVGLINEKK